ncbi:endonuclease domain-containing protein [Catellatospora methionotrophica]|uniref:endonuclease domain-containing protein n=1 Tax=Catellatospora methionotrophica TaxID=121620 RepID=UPI003405B13C
MAELEWVLFAQSNVVSWAQASGLLTAAKVRHRVRTGRWRQVCRGVLVAGDGPLSVDQQRWVAVLAAGPGARLAGLAAAQAGGLRGRFRDERIDVLVAAGGHRPDLFRRLPLGMPAVKVRRTGHLPEVDCQLARPVRTSMARSVVDAASWARFPDQAQVIVAAACQQRLTTPDELCEVLGRLPRAPRRELIAATVRDAAGGAGALSEIDFLRLCRKHRLPVPELQQRRVDASGRVRYRDAYWREFGLHVEVDGGHHMEVGHCEADMRRQNYIWTSGDRILRFTAHQVRNHPADVAATLRTALLAAGWSPAK